MSLLFELSELPYITRCRKSHVPTKSRTKIDDIAHADHTALLTLVYLFAILAVPA